MADIKFEINLSVELCVEIFNRTSGGSVIVETFFSQQVYEVLSCILEGKIGELGQYDKSVLFCYL